MADRDAAPERSTTRWQRVQELFHRALERRATERVDFLDEACFGNVALRRDVEELLAAETGAGERIDSAIAGALWLIGRQDRAAETGDLTVPPAGPQSSPGDSQASTIDIQPAAAAAAPRHIGPYRILRTLGRGGMGSVYLAERDDEHYRQQVAIKVMRHGLDHPEVLRRLRQERQILAHLDHPNIARLLDGGNTPGGLPYYVMERVEGEPIQAYCDLRRLPIRARLELFLQVCSAVQYAHRHLVVHRDLKPSNILVSEDGTPKLLDFGIAKLLDPELADPMFTPTLPGMRLLTPQYASPEQILGEPLNTASDVYSLGVLLYELLTGHRPHHSARRGELERMVCEIEPLPPSERIRASLEGADVEPTPSAISAARASTPERLRRRLRGDLDIVVLAALHKEPARRYASVEHLADDLRRHLAALPVSARRDSLAYRSRKFIARHRLAVATAAAVLATIVGLVFFYTLRLGEQRDAAERAARRARQETLRAQREAAKSEQVTGFLTGIFRTADPNVAKGEEATVLEVLDRGAQQLEHRLRGQPALLSQMRDVIALVYLGRGLYREARELFQRSLDERLDRLGEEHADVAVSLQHLGDVAYLESDPQRAAKLFRRALDLRLRLFGPAHLQVAASRHDLATALYSEPDSARVSLELYKQALTIRRRELGDGHPDVAETLSSLGHVYHDLGRLADAEAHLREALAARRAHYGELHESVSTSMINLSELLLDRGELEEAGKLRLRVIEIDRTILPEDHPNQIWNQTNLAAFYGRTGELDLARQAYDEALEKIRRTGDLQREALTWRNIGDLYRDAGEAAAARSAYESALASSRAATDDLGASFSLMRLGNLERRGGRPQRAEPYFRQALGIRQRLPGSRQPTGRSRIALTRADLGACLLEQGRLRDAASELCASRRVLNEIFGAEHAEARAAEAHLIELRKRQGRSTAAAALCADPGRP